MKSIVKSLAVALMLTVGVVNASNDIQIYTADNSKGKITGASIEKTFEDAGFEITAHNDMNVAFKGKFQKTHHKMYRLFGSYKMDLVLELIKISPRAAVLTPLSMSIYMKNDSNDISMSSLTLQAMAKITGIPASNKHLVAYAKLIKSTLEKALPNGSYEKIKYSPTKPAGELITAFSFELEEMGSADSITEEIEGYQEELEGSLSTAGFVMPYINTIGDEFIELGYDKYDSFTVYSICKLSVIFQVSKNNPEAGAFAPCTLTMFKEKGSSEVHMEYPSVHNWVSSLGLKDKASLDVLNAAEETMTNVVNETIE